MSQRQTETENGQRWSAWVPGRQQWLLGTIIRKKDGRVTLKFDSRYEIRSGEDECEVDEQDLLRGSNLFRYIAQS